MESEYLDITEAQVWSHKKGGTRFTWPNGNSVSMVFGPGSYTQNHMLPFEKESDPAYTIKSTTVEIMIDGGGEFAQWFETKYDGNNPAGGIPVSDIPEILFAAMKGDN